MKDVKKFRDFLELLARSHKSVQHSDNKIHFTSTIDSYDNGLPRTLHYPCVVLDMGDMHVQGENLDRNVVLMFLEHVKDTGSEKQKDEAFDKTGDIAIDFLVKLERTADSVPSLRFLSRVEVDGADLLRVELKDAALYGWMVQMKHSFSLCKVVCEDRFSEDVDALIVEHFK